MKFTVAISGTQGTGKSTIIKGLEDAGICVDKTQLSREAQISLGWNRLSLAQESINNMWELQYRILDTMALRDARINDSGILTVCERSPLDVMAYTALWLRRNGVSTSNPRAEAYFSQCREMLNEYRSILILKPVKEIPFVPDPHRADEESRNSVMNDIDEFSTGIKTLTFTTISKADRIAEAIRFIKKDDQ